tara:strand:+ start:2251 stop:2640 length:390 start_codon:yes stop_codon:yes gene_type:complete
LEVRPDPDEPEDEEERRLLPLRAATERLEPLRAELLRRVVVARLLATGVTSTVAEEAAESEEAATALDAVLFFAPADTWPEALAETDVVDAAEDAEERRRGAGLAMGIDAMGEIKGGSRSVTHPASSGR